ASLRHCLPLRSGHMPCCSGSQASPSGDIGFPGEDGPVKSPLLWRCDPLIFSCCSCLPRCWVICTFFSPWILTYLKRFDRCRSRVLRRLGVEGDTEMYFLCWWSLERLFISYHRSRASFMHARRSTTSRRR